MTTPAMQANFTEGENRIIWNLLAAKAAVQRRLRPNINTHLVRQTHYSPKRAKKSVLSGVNTRKSFSRDQGFRSLSPAK
jgi:hypothetical protein